MPRGLSRTLTAAPTRTLDVAVPTRCCTRRRPLRSRLSLCRVHGHCRHLHCRRDGRGGHLSAARRQPARHVRGGSRRLLPRGERHRALPDTDVRMSESARGGGVCALSRAERTRQQWVRAMGFHPISNVFEE
eukprot:2521752-Prymnesium_polylepis.1